MRALPFAGDVDGSVAMARLPNGESSLVRLRVMGRCAGGDMAGTFDEALATSPGPDTPILQRG